jgi:hypothetical protein
MFRAAVRRKSWRSIPGHPALRYAVSHAFRNPAPLTEHGHTFPANVRLLRPPKVREEPRDDAAEPLLERLHAGHLPR